MKHKYTIIYEQQKFEVDAEDDTEAVKLGE